MMFPRLGTGERNVNLNKNNTSENIALNKTNIALLILRKIWQSHLFLCYESLKRRVYGVKWIKSIFADKRNSETRFGAPLYYLKCGSHFFYKIDLQQYLIKLKI